MKQILWLTFPLLFVFNFFCLSMASEKLPIQQVWTQKEYSDPNDRHLKYVQLDADLFDRLFSKVDSKSHAIQLWHADVNNDGQTEYIFVQTPLYKPGGTSDGRLLDRVGPVFRYSEGKVTEVKMPSIPIEYTNISLPFLEYGKSGLQMNLHYAAEVGAGGHIHAIGNEAKPKRGSFILSHRMTVLWKGDSLTKLTERFVCDEAVCSKKQLATIKRATFPKIK